MAPCNCKKKVAPLSASGTASTTTTTQRGGAWYSPGKPESLTASGGYTLTVNGVTTVYGSKLEYEAARRRAQL